MTERQLNPKEFRKLIDKIIALRRSLTVILVKVKKAGKATDGQKKTVIDLRNKILKIRGVLEHNGCNEVELRMQISERNRKRRRAKKGFSGKGLTKGGVGVYRLGGLAKFWR